MEKIIVPLFFIVVFLIGAFIYGDYGANWDEYYHLNYGALNWNYVFNNASYNSLYSYNSDHSFNHGPLIQIVVFGLTKLWGFEDSSSILYFRHFFFYVLSFVGLIFFYFLCKKLFNSWKYGLLGVLILVLSPRQLSHSFYNNIDIPLMGGFIICAYTLVLLLEKLDYKYLIFHSIAIAYVTSIRSIGIIMFFLTLILLIYKVYRSQFKLIYLVIFFFLSLLIILFLVILSWPVLWENTFNNLPKLVVSTLKNSVPIPVTYFGLINSHTLPWHYNLVWIGISVPLFYLIFLIIGLVLFIYLLYKSFINKRHNNLLSKLDQFYHNSFILEILFSFFILIFLALIVPIIQHSSLFDNWRHHYFIYPFMIIFMILGIKFCYDLVRLYYKNKLVYFYILFFIIFMNVFNWMVILHPNQHLFLNSLAPKNPMGTLDTDEWGLLYKPAFNKIIELDNSPKIKVYVTDYIPAFNNRDLLSLDKRNRIILTNLNDADYIIDNFRYKIQKLNYSIIYMINYYGVDYLVIYKAK